MDPEKTHQTTAEAWLEWRRACTIERCGGETRAMLAGFARSRFRAYAKQICRDGIPAGAQPYLDPETQRGELAWYDLEERLCRSRGRQPGEEGPEQKVYKNWLFEKAAGEPEPVEFLQKYTSTMVRTGVGEMLEFEGCSLKARRAGIILISTETTPLDSKSENRSTLLELLRAPSVTVDGTDPTLETDAREEAERVFAGLPRRLRIALAAKALGLPLYDFRVTLTAGCGKSMLSDACSAFEKSLPEEIRKEFEGETVDALCDIYRRLWDHLFRLAVEWKISEIGDNALF